MINEISVVEVLRNCTTNKNIIILPNFCSYGETFLSIKEIMYDFGGKIVLIGKNKGFLFKEHDSSSKQTENLLKTIIESNS